MSAFDTATQPNSDVGPGAAGSTFEFGTKGQTLARLAPLLRVPVLCDQLIVTVASWGAERERLTRRIIEKLGPGDLAVRSSCRMEDGAEESNAGAYRSVTGVRPETEPVARAVDRVIAAYGECPDDEEVLIQPMVLDVALSGVVLTRELDTGGPYYVINYDDFSGRTDTVTAGAESKLVLVHRANPDAIHSPRIRKIIAAARELEIVTGLEELDIEFCVTSDVEIHVLQVRPLAAQRRWRAVPDDDIDAALLSVRTQLHARMAPMDGLAGTTSILGEMPDWNPAEMIGNTPRPLAISLYKKLITDRTWSVARADMGYREVDHPLMMDCAGRPYIDVRLSLNSFLPAAVDAEFANRLVDYQLSRLAGQADLHDKIEFEIAITCRDLSFPRRAQDLREAGFADAEIEAFGEAILAITNRALAGGPVALRDLLSRTNRVLDHTTAATAGDPLGRAGNILTNCIDNGTLPFSKLARHCFIGMAMLRSFVEREILSSADADRFMRSIHTVAGDLVDDMASVARGDVDRKTFLATYGHLRPGTYDVTSLRYDENPDLYLGHSAKATPPAPEFHLKPSQAGQLDNCLSAERFACTADGLITYISAAVAAREQAKFAFTKGISDSLVALTEWGEAVGIDRDDLSFLAIETIFEHADDPDHLAAAVDQGRKAHRITRALHLPHLIVEADDIDVVRPLRGEATFITEIKVAAKTRFLDAHEVADLDGRIVLIESADPGFDWIFSHNIVALITKFGGANSHMAIRCAEFGLPAAIGCGERGFDKLLRAGAIELNCAARTIRPVGG